jgi:hypothetical protein
MTLVSHSDDLQRLVDEGYDLEIRDNNLLLKHVPCVSSDRSVDYCILVSELSHNGERTITPATHEVWVVGPRPCDHTGQELPIINQPGPHDFGGGLVASCSMSAKRHGEVPRDYYVKMTTYVDALSGNARAIDPDATAITWPAHETVADESVFRYLDAASSRSGISAVTAQLKLQKVVIVGLGGTGSYILDLVSKTPVAAIHLYDDDVLYAHNAFRTPGAAAFAELRAMPKKVDYLHGRYDAMHPSIIVHRERVDAGNVAELHDADFVFVAVDTGPAKQVIVESLTEREVPFIDCGIGMHRRDNSLGGSVRVTASDAGHRTHLEHRVGYGKPEPDEYDWNIQTADLNMLNAALAVIRWKKMFGFYMDGKQEFNSVYSVGRNQLVNGDIEE